MKLNWQRHYTGIETAEIGSRYLDLYLRRDPATKRVCFARLSGYRWMLGIFLGNTNSIGGRGFEIFTSDIHIGWGGYSRRTVTWSGSAVDPYARYTVHLLRFAFGSTTDRWLKWLKRAIEQRRYERECAEYDLAFPEYEESER